MIIIKGLQKEYSGLKVLHEINLSINAGDIYGLVGRSGAGKSTLLRCINGLEEYNGGQLLVSGHEIHNYSKNELREFRKGIGMIFQHFSLLERKTVYDNVALPMVCWKHPKEQINKKVKELLELVGISDKINEKPRYLSGGQKQRVAIARALSLNPKILLCDEATSALDPKTTKSILELLKEINEKLGITIVVVTHQVEVVRHICNKACILENGRIVEEGSVEEVFLRNSPALRRFLGEENTLNYGKGRHIQVFLPENPDNRNIFTKMALDLNFAYSIVGGKTERYRDKILSSFILTFSEDQYPVAVRYLKSKNILWENIEVEKEMTC
ncbi:MAG TPA: ABC transporter ATP-binding protein [Clostridiales bacterium]|nr:ABC transporter ATP-binding protein [Clostridiales bacterium]